MMRYSLYKCVKFSSSKKRNFIFLLIFALCLFLNQNAYSNPKCDPLLRIVLPKLRIKVRPNQILPQLGKTFFYPFVLPFRVVKVGQKVLKNGDTIWKASFEILREDTFPILATVIGYTVLNGFSETFVAYHNQTDDFSDIAPEEEGIILFINTYHPTRDLSLYKYAKMHFDYHFSDNPNARYEEIEIWPELDTIIREIPSGNKIIRLNIWGHGVTGNALTYRFF